MRPRYLNMGTTDRLMPARLNCAKLLLTVLHVDYIMFVAPLCRVARRAIGMCVFSYFCVDFQSSVLPNLTLACASCRGQCDGTFCFAIFCRVFDLLPSADSLFVEVGGDL